MLEPLFSIPQPNVQRLFWCSYGTIGRGFAPRCAFFGCDGCQSVVIHMGENVAVSAGFTTSPSSINQPGVMPGNGDATREWMSLHGFGMTRFGVHPGD